MPLRLLVENHFHVASGLGVSPSGQWAHPGPCSGKVTAGDWATANQLILAGHVAPNPLYEDMSVIGTRDDGAQFRPGFNLAFSLPLAYAVVKRSIHIPLNQIQLLIREKVL